MADEPEDVINFEKIKAGDDAEISALYAISQKIHLRAFERRLPFAEKAETSGYFDELFMKAIGDIKIEKINIGDVGDFSRLLAVRRRTFAIDIVRGKKAKKRTTIPDYEAHLEQQTLRSSAPLEAFEQEDLLDIIAARSPDLAEAVAMARSSAKGNTSIEIAEEFNVGRATVFRRRGLLRAAIDAELGPDNGYSR